MAMDTASHYFFIVNPIAGKGNELKIIPEIERFLSERKISFRIKVTEKPGHAFELAKNALEEKSGVIVAVGGDGTINEVASAIAGSNARLGIIPMGSGNGLARELSIPLSVHGALRNLLNGTIKKIDTGECNGHFFACTVGVGFDAHLANKFLTQKSRGLAGYIKIFLREFFSYSEKKYQIKINNKTIETTAFLITVANCRQWGNNFYISPLSKNNDGRMELCIIKKFPLVALPVLLFRVLGKTIHKSVYFKSYSADTFTIIQAEPSCFHTDGEIVQDAASLSVILKPGHLTAIGG